MNLETTLNDTISLNTWEAEKDENLIYDYAVKVQNLSFAYNSNLVLSNVNLKIPTGKIAAVIGPNGAGKTTLIKAMLGLIKPLSGKTSFFSDSLISRKVLMKKIGYVPQSGSVDWDFPVNVLDVVMMGRYGRLGWIKRPKAPDFKICEQTLDKVGMLQYKNRQISELSGGQQQRVFIARALVQEADLYFMDEPFKGVDANTEKTIMHLLHNLKDDNKTVVAVHHDLSTVKDYFEWGIMINKSVIADGVINEIFNDENLRNTYMDSTVALKGVK